MKNFGIECLTLLMIAVMVYAAPINPCEDKRLKLKQIREHANKALKDHLPDFNVPKIEKCVEKFFCLADKALNKSLENNSNQNLATLEHSLRVYSKDENCHLHTQNQYNIKDFLEKIVHCVDVALNNKSIICPHHIK
ncbi:uncharacterized protein LOC143413934 [Maylandia zebra]|uniref:uncharacterized protein LOC143413934 n=1 Tax=Maylandia zebra TaxID=106582 RepID=UPI00403D37AB